MSKKWAGVLSCMIVVCMIIMLMPLTVFASGTDGSTLTTDIEDKTFTVGMPTEFTFTTTAGSDAGKMVIGTSAFDNMDAIEKLEYYEVKDGNWYELTGDFGPSTGFPMSDATSKFRVTFKEAGEYTFTASMKEVETGDILCSTEVTFTVNDADEPGTDEPGTDEPGTDVPETGDSSNIALWSLLLLVSGAVLAGMVIYGRKLKCNR